MYFLKSNENYRLTESFGTKNRLFCDIRPCQDFVENFDRCDFCIYEISVKFEENGKTRNCT